MKAGDTTGGGENVNAQRIIVEQSFSQDIPEFTRESGEAGWVHFIQQKLPEFLNRS